MSKPVRLAKQDENKFNRIYNLLYCRIERWVLAHLTLCIILMLIIGMICFIVLAYALVGVSATGDTIYNGMEAVI